MYIVHTKSEPRLVEFSEQIQKENSSNFKAKTVDPIFPFESGHRNLSSKAEADLQLKRARALLERKAVV